MTEADKVIPGKDHPWTMRLQRFLARAGVASRRGSEDLITAGRVSVNGAVVTELGTKVTLGVDEVAVDGRTVAMGEGPVYLMLHKPAGYLTTMADPQGRPCVAELVPRERFPGLFPVGRLDKDTTGLLLFTTDGDTGNRLLHPSFHVPKRYLALVDGHLADEELEPLRQGITLDDGPCRPAPCAIVDRTSACELWPDDTQTIENGTVTPVSIELREGRKNQVKRMFGAIHHPVIRLHRDRMGSLTLGELAEGEWRELEEAEVAALKSDMQRMASENDPSRTREDEK
ncbi:pseudouridine synthase [Collinsella sp. An307]|uniref:pseudouridine synthase n=1 Tax=Collinsella sp. An307 TaxID=1965630 RepID=UPI001EF48BEC|nr:pseudouridine synthase [Collinsella sp. An307]